MQNIKQARQMTNTQVQITTYLKTVESASKADLYELFSPGYYHNGEKHFGEILSRMVKRGLIKRIKKGCFAIGSPIVKEVKTNQLRLI